MKKILMGLVAAVFAFSLSGCGEKEKKEITISAAASLNEVLSQVAENYKKENKMINKSITISAF